MDKNRIKITDLEFDSIKNNLKDFLRAQDVFQDYDFEGSGLNILLDVLAYNTYYNSYYLNMVANESSISTAILRDSVVAHAKNFGYIPYSRAASRTFIDIQIDAWDDRSTLTLPRGTSFKSSLVDNRTYSFVLLEPKTVTRSSDNVFYFTNLEIFEGTLLNYTFYYNKNSNPKRVFTIPDVGIDTKSMVVTITDESTGSFSQKEFKLSKDITEISPESEVYFLQENDQLQYQVFFGDDILGKALNDGTRINVNVLTTSGESANGISSFSLGNSVDGIISYRMTVHQKTYGGSSRESVDSIKYSATNSVPTQNRLVSTKDYESYILSNYPSIASASVWGGETNEPKVIGTNFISLKPKSNYFLTTAAKDSIIDNLKAKSIPSIRNIIVDPEYLYILLDCKVKYDPSKTTSPIGVLNNVVRTTIINYKLDNIDRFNSNFKLSKLSYEIDFAHGSFVGNDTSIRVQSRFRPFLNRQASYTINFNNPLVRGRDSLIRLESTEFNVYDSSNIQRTVMLEEVPQSFTGISKINITNPGFDYREPPTVTIVGDGSGATATARIVGGRIRSIDVTNPGIGYSKATVIVSGGGGIGAYATALVELKEGTLRTVYFDNQLRRVIVNQNAGTINYETGTVTISDINILSVGSLDGMIRLTTRPENTIINTVRNTILTIDDSDSSSIITTVSAI